jgi:DNA-binding NtrC family response regulator
LVSAALHILNSDRTSHPRDSQGALMIPPQRILVVDDERKVLFVLRHALARLVPHCQVETFDASLAALEAARKEPFHLAITALRMPGMDGIALTEALIALPDAPVVIWMTAYDCRTTAQDALRLGVYRCLDKPLEVDEIRHAVCEALENACRQVEREYVANG